MFQKIIQDSLKVDMLFIDGRLAQEDLGMLSSLMSEDCIIVLDDFEGVEKGVVNAMMLRGVLKNYILLEPMVDRNGVVLNLAIMVPSSLLSLSRQQSLPVNM